MAFLYLPALTPPLNVNGDRMPGAKLRFCLSGTTTLTSVYEDKNLGTPLTNPVEADGAGEFPLIFLNPNVSYRATLYDANDVQILDVDPYDIAVPSTVALLATLAGTGGAALIGTSTGETVEERLGRTAFSIGLFDTFAGTPPEIDSTVDVVYTSGYSATGIGIARYIQDNAVDSTFVSTYPNVSFIDSLGRGWRLDHEQRLTIEMYGGRGYDTQANAEAGVDNIAAVQAYEAYNQFEPNTGVNAQYYPFLPDLHLGAHFYYFSDTWEPRAIVRVRGLATGSNVSGVPAGTVWVVPDDTTAIILPNTNTLADGAFNYNPTSQGCLIEGISFQGGGTDTDAHGVWMRTVGTLSRCGFYGIAGHGIFINATAGSGGATEGNANLWEVDGCFVHSCGGDGLHVEGSDGNAGICIRFNTQECGGCGIYDSSGLGNYYFGFHIAGYGNSGVTHGGRRYVLVDHTAGIGAATTPGTNNEIWYDMGAGAVTADFPAWSSSNTYTLQLPIYSGGASSRSVFVGGYVEGSLPCHVSGAGIMFGGTTPRTRYTPMFDRITTQTRALYSPTGVGTYTPYVPNHSTLGSYFEASVGTQDGVILGHRQQSDGDASWQFKYSGKDMIYQFNDSGLVPFGITGTNTSKTMGRSTAVPRTFYADGMGLGDPSNSNNTRYIQYGSAAPASGAHARGEIVFNVAPSAGGTVGWVCTAGGSPGTWKTFGTIAA